MHSRAKPSRHCAGSAKRTNRTLGMIRRTIVSRDHHDVTLRLYKSLTRPGTLSKYTVQSKL